MSNARLRALLSCTVLLLSCSCTTVLKEQKAEVALLSQVNTVARSNTAASQGSALSIVVPSSSQMVVPGADPTAFVLRTPERMLSEIAVIEFRRMLLERGIHRVYTDPTPNADYIVQLACSELVPDVTQLADQTRVPTLEAGTLLLALSPALSSSSAALPGVGALLQTFEPLSGLALSNSAKEQVGSLTIEVQVQKPNGQIVSAKSFPASFAARALLRGGVTSTSNYKAVAASYPQDAVRLAVEESLKHFESLLR